MSDQPGKMTVRGRAITVTYDQRVCIRSGNCIASLPEVFDPTANIWIRPDRAAADRTAAVVRRYPSDALGFESSGGAEGGRPER